MVDVAAGNFERPDETRLTGDKGRIDVVRLGTVTVGRTVFQPGWRWSEHVKPIVGTDSCEVTHTGYVFSGRLRVRMNDGNEYEAGPGDAFMVPSGHDAWVIGDEPWVALDFSGMARYAKTERPASGEGSSEG